MSDIILDGWTENDRDRRKSENKFTTFLNRSTQSLSLVRSKSKEGKSRTSDRSTKDKNAKGQAMVLDCSLQTSGERNTRVSPSRLPTFSSTHDKRSGLQVKTTSTRPAEYIHGAVLAISTAAGTATTTTAIGASGRSVSPLQTDANVHTLPRYTQPKRIGSSSNSKSPYSTYSRASTRSPPLSSSPTTRSPVSTSITPKADSRLPTLSMGVSSSSHAAQASSSSPISTTSVNAAAIAVRSVTPTSTTSSTGRKMFGLLSRKSSLNAGTGITTTTTPTAKSATATAATTTTQTAPTRPSSQDERTASHVKWGSLSSRTPLLPIDSRGSDESLLLLRRTASESKRASPPLSPIRSSTKSRDSMLTLKLKTGSTTTSAADVVRKRSSSKLEFWRSSRTNNAHTPVPEEKGKQKNVDITEQGGHKEKEKGSKVKTQSTIVSPQPRAPVAFLPIPRLSRTPPAPDKGGVGVGARAVAPVSSRIDSFMSDSMPLPLPTTESSSSGAGTGTSTDTTTPVPVAAVAAAAMMSATATDKIRLTTPKQDATIMTRHTHFAKPESDNTKELMPRAKSAPASGGGTVGKGRSSPCLRIPSPKFLHRDKDKDKEKEKIRDRKERRLTPECVSSPILRDRPIPKARVNKGEKSSQGQNQQRHYQAPTYSIVPVVKKARRITHGSFDFERPGSRSSSKSGVSDPKSSSCRSEEGDASGVKTPVVPTTAIATTITTTTRVTEMGVLRKESVSAHGHRSPTTRLRTLEHVDEAEPVPPLPTITSRLGRKSSLHRARKSPSPTNAYSPRAPHSPLYSTSASSATHDDDADLPRLTSSLARRGLGVGGVRRGQIVHPAFEFEPVGHARPSMLSHGSSVVAYSPTPSLTPRPVGGVYTTDTSGVTHKLRPKDANTPTQQHYYEHHQNRRVEHVVDSRTGLLWAPLPLKENGDSARPRSPLRVGNGSGGGRKGKEVNWAKIEAEVAAGQDVDMISPKALEEATEVIGALKNVLNDAGFTTLQKYVRRFDSQVIPLDGPTGLIARVQRLLDTSAPRADERQKRQLLDSFRRVVCQTSH